MALVATVAACSAADTSKPSLVVVQCEPGAANCSGDAVRKPTGGTAPSGDQATPAGSGESPFGTDAGTTPPKDAGGAMGYQCTQLKRCCDELTVLKITGSARQCNETVGLKGEVGCGAVLRDLQAPDENGETICKF